MSNPLIEQGSLNRLRASVVWPDNPSLNVTSSYLGEGGIDVDLDGEATTFLPTMTGAVTSPEPYQMITMRIHLLKTQGLASLYKKAQETNSLLGNCTVRPDTKGLDPYPFVNCGIGSVKPDSFNGKGAGFTVTIRGYYLTNQELYDS